MTARKPSDVLEHLDISLYKLIFDSSYDGIYFVDTDRRILMWNPAAERITGFNADEVVGRYCHDKILQHEDGLGNLLCHQGCPLQKCMDVRKPGADRVTLRRADGVRVAVDVSVAPICGYDGLVRGAVEIFRDVTTYERLEAATARITKLTYKDYLTGIANRREISRTLEREVRRARRYDEPLGLAMVDVDKFKHINDTYGHPTGDAALKRVAHALKRAVRDSDSLGRFGGDEFVVVAPSTTPDGLAALAERMRARVERAGARMPETPVTISVGATTLKPQEATKDLVARTDAALYEAKRAGGNRVALRL